MDKVKNLLACLCLFLLAFLIWAYKVNVSGDFPSNITFSEFAGLSTAILVYVILHYFCIKKLKSYLILLNLLLLVIFLLALWFTELSQAFANNYSKYDTIIDVIGLLSVITTIGLDVVAFRLQGKEGNLQH